MADLTQTFTLDTNNAFREIRKLRNELSKDLASAVKVDSSEFDDVVAAAANQLLVDADVQVDSSELDAVIDALADKFEIEAGVEVGTDEFDAFVREASEAQAVKLGIDVDSSEFRRFQNQLLQRFDIDSRVQVEDSELDAALRKTEDRQVIDARVQVNDSELDAVVSSIEEQKTLKLDLDADAVRSGMSRLLTKIDDDFVGIGGDIGKKFGVSIAAGVVAAGIGGLITTAISGQTNANVIGFRANLDAEETAEAARQARDLVREGIEAELAQTTTIAAFQFDIDSTDLEDLARVAANSETDVRQLAEQVNLLQESGDFSTFGEGLEFVTALAGETGRPLQETIDVLREFRPVFDQAGVSAQEWGAVLNQATDFGLRDQSLLADLIKETNNLLGEPIDFSQWEIPGSVVAGLEGVQAAFNAGEVSALEASLQVRDLLAGLDDVELAREIQIAVSGTPFKDLGSTFEQLDLSTAVEVDIATAAANIDGLDDSVAEQLRALRGEFSAGVGEFSAEFVLPILVEVLPIIREIFEFLSQNQGLVVGVLTAIGVVIAGLVVPAVYAWAAGMVAANAPLLLIAAGVGALVAGLIYAYTNFETFRNFVDAARNTLLDVWGFLSDNVIPIFLAVGQVIVDVVVAAFRGIASFVTDVLVPAFNIVWGFLSNNVLPIFRVVADFVIDRLVDTFRQVATFVTDVLVPAFSDWWGFLDDNVLPILETVAGFLVDNLVSSFDRVSDGIDIAKEAFSSISDFISGAFTNSIDAVNVPLQSISDLLGSIFDLAEQAFDQIGRLTNFGGGLGAIGSAAGSVFSAYGRVTTKPTLSWLSEFNHPEATLSSLVSPQQNINYMQQAGLFDPVKDVILRQHAPPPLPAFATGTPSGMPSNVVVNNAPPVAPVINISPPESMNNVAWAEEGVRQMRLAAERVAAQSLRRQNA